MTNCLDYFAQAAPDTRPLNAHELPALLELIVMCRATRTLQSAQASTRSFMNDFKLTQDAPSLLPGELGLIISAGEYDARFASAPDHWSDVNRIQKVSVVSFEHAVVEHDSGRQEVELVGRGDFDGDGLEDILLTSRDSVEGGDYFNLRLFALTRHASSEPIRVLVEHSWTLPD